MADPWVIQIPGNVGPPPSGDTHPVPQCPHADVELRVQERGVKRVRIAVRQCLACGKQLGSVARGKLGTAGLPAFDYALRERGNEERYAALIRAREQRQAAWWAWYDAYLKSPDWHRRRAAVLHRDHHTCRVMWCGKKATQVHHQTYERVGNENLDDLIAVCDACHDKIHANRTGQ